MTQKQALQDLLAKIEAGEAVINDFVSAFQDGFAAHSAFIVYGGSLDAAKALHEAVLPGWWVQHLGQVRGGWRVRLETQGKSIPEGMFNLHMDNPARAWLVAIIKALIEEHKTP
jgi:hypothetical protein